MGNLVIISNRLPISVKKLNGKLEFSPSIGGLATGLSAYTKRRGTVWVGWPGIADEDLTESDRGRITRELKKHHCYPVFLSQKQIEDYYNGYSNSVLWPLFHDLTVKPAKRGWWSAYEQVNQQFAEEALRLSKPGSTVWIHDYQLLLVPELIRQANRHDNIGYFLHIPFPADTALQQLPEAKHLLRGVLGADLAGFHTTGYSRNFLNACDLLLASGRHKDYVEYQGRAVRISEFPMGIDYNRFAEALKEPASRKALRKLRREYRGQKIILTVDRLDPSKGLIERLQAYYELLKRNPKLRGTITMIMIVAPSRTDISEYKALKQKLDKLLADITADFSTKDWQPVDFKYESVPLEMVMLYYHLADIAFIAPLRDGMNLVAKEFLASKPKNNGVLILSETAGAAEELRDAIQVNPHHPETLVKGLRQALYLPKRDLRLRATRMQHHIKEFTVQAWATSFMDTLQQPLSVAQIPTHALSEKRIAELQSSYQQATKRLLLLDYDGVLREFVKDPAAAKPTAQLLKLLKSLGDEPANEVVIISGRSKQDLASWFGDLSLALAAEHGAFFRRKGGKNWHRTTQGDPAWYNQVKDLFNYYTVAVPGSLVEQKDTALVWHYRAASPYHAQKNLVAIRRLLKPILKRYKLIAKDGHKVLEVHPRDISKGRAAQEWLIHDHDFILAMGDDVTDEDMFKALPPSSYSVKVGRGQTAANYRLKNVNEVIHLLKKL